MKRCIVVVLSLLLLINCLFASGTAFAADTINFSADRLTDIPFADMKTDEATKEKVVALMLANLNNANPEIVKSIFSNIGNGTCTICYMPMTEHRVIFVYVSTHDMFYYLYYAEPDNVCKYSTEQNKRGIDTEKDALQIGQYFTDKKSTESYTILNIGNVMYNLLDLITETDMGDDL